MTFLNPLVLLGLAAASIPLILHLLNLRKLRTIDFSSLRFLKELQKTSMRRIRFRQILLLILRTLLVIAIVLAFSRPALRGSFAGLGGTEAASTMVILLDDSPSMIVRDERGSAFARAQQSAAHVADLAQDGDKLYLLPLSEARFGAPLPAARNAASVRTALEKMAPTMFTTPYATALRCAARILAASSDANRELVLITDGQATQFHAPEGAFDSSAGLDAQTRVFLVPSPPLRRGNGAVGPAHVTTRIITGRKPVLLTARLGNFGDTPITGAIASVYSAGSRVAQRSADVPANGAIDQDFQFSPVHRGIAGGYVEIGDDVYEPDNKWYYTLTVPENVNVLLAGPNENATVLASLAITLAGDSTLAGSFSLRRATESELASSDLSRYDVVILCGLRGPAAPTGRRLARFVESGGGLVLFPGPESVPVLYNDNLLPVLGLPRWGTAPVTQPQGTHLTFGKVDFAHPLFEGMFDASAGARRRPAAIESPRIVTSIPIGAGERGTGVITLSNGGTFLADYGAGNGRVLVFAVDAGLGWSDFPLKGIFAPLLHRALLYLAARPTEQPFLTAGEPLRITARLRDLSDRDTYSLTGPDGTARRIIPVFQPGTGTAAFSAPPPPEPGVYTVTRDRREGERAARGIAAAAVNVSPAESNLQTVNEEELRTFWEREGISAEHVRAVAPGETPEESIRRSRFGVELWRHFLALAAALALAEMVAGRAARPQGEGGEGA